MTTQSFEYGDILLVLYPFTDQSFAKPRPVVVMSREEFNRSGDIVVLPLSSRLRGTPFEVAMTPNHPQWKQSKLLVASAVKWTKPITIATSVVLRRLGVMPDDVMFALTEKVQDLVSPPGRLRALAAPPQPTR